MPWKSSSPTAIGRQKTMARSKSGSRSIRGQISAPKPLDDSLVTEFAEPNHLELSREQTHLSRTASSQLHADSQIHHANDISPSTTAVQTYQGAAQRVGFNDINYNNTTQESGKRLSNSQTKPPTPRKRSPIRDALSRLFGRRKKTASQLTTVSEPPPQRTSAPLQQMVNMITAALNVNAFRLTRIPETTREYWKSSRLSRQQICLIASH